MCFLIGFKFGFRQFTKTFQIWFLDKPFAMLDFMDLTLHVHVAFFVDVDCEHVEMLRSTTSRLESNRGHLQFNSFSRLATNQDRSGMAIFAKCLCIPSLGVQAYEFSCQKLFCTFKIKA